MIDFRETTVEALVARVKAKDVSARELTAAALARIEEVNPRVNAFIAVDGERALAEAEGIDARLARGEEVGPLAGIPIGVKDLEDAIGYVTGSSSAMHADDAPSARDSVHVARLRKAGCVVVGKTNAPEMGLKPLTDNPTFGITRNPWDLDRTPGGSSGGTSAALASGMIPLATGSDGGGSIRIPSAACGLSGMKTALGRVPAGDPRIPSWHDLSVRGPMARRIRDVATALDCVVGPHPHDQRSLPAPGSAWRPALDAPQRPRRVAWSSTLGYADTDGEVDAACRAVCAQLEAAGVEVVEVEKVFSADPGSVIGALVPIYMYAAVGRYLTDELWTKLDPLVAVSAEMAGATASALSVLEAEAGCHNFGLELAAVFEDVDLLLCPTMCGQLPRCQMDMTVDEMLAQFASGTDLSAAAGTIDIVSLLERLRKVEPINFPLGQINGALVLDWTRLTQPFNMTRSPAATTCAGLTADGLPIGLQIIGPQHGDVAVLSATAFIEDLVGFDQLAPV